MASTRNRNTPLDYNLEKKNNNLQQQHNLYSSAGRPTSECMPAIGYTPSHMAREALSNNSIDIESSLYGIGASNLVEPCEPVNPSIRNIEFKEWFERQKEVIMPYPLVFNDKTRPSLA